MLIFLHRSPLFIQEQYLPCTNLVPSEGHYIPDCRKENFLQQSPTLPIKQKRA